MALKSQSLFLYGYTITVANQYLDFKNASGGSQLTALIPLGYYSLGDLCTAIATAMMVADPTNTYTCTATRTYSNGTQNRVTIATTTGSYLSLLFSSGTNHLASVCTTIGFAASDNTGSLTYTGTSSSGTSFTSTLVGYNYIKPTRYQKIFGVTNISTAGYKEAIVFPNFQQFVEVTFKYEPEAIMDSQWNPFFEWAISQQSFEFTPEITNPTTFYNVTLDKTPSDGSGLGFQFVEQVSEIPFLYQIGPITLRINPL